MIYQNLVIKSKLLLNKEVKKHELRPCLQYHKCKQTPSQFATKKVNLKIIT